VLLLLLGARFCAYAEERKKACEQRVAKRNAPQLDSEQEAGLELQTCKRHKGDSMGGAAAGVPGSEAAAAAADGAGTVAASLSTGTAPAEAGGDTTIVDPASLSVDGKPNFSMFIMLGGH
jgi:hypothetical protein